MNLLAPINSLGFGTVGLNVALSLQKAGVNPSLFVIGTPEAPPEHHEALRAMIAQAAFYDPSAPSIRIWHQFDLAQHVGRGPHCAYPFFELDRFRPVELHHLKSQDVVFAPSLWARQVLIEQGVNKKNIFYAPPGVDTTVFVPKPIENIPGEPTVFLSVGKWEYRKGHDVLLRVFCKAFGPEDNVRLVMNCHNPCFSTREEMERYNAEWMSMYKNSPMGDKVEVIEKRLPTQHHLSLLMNSADCGVFLSRGEGWNLGAAEMLAMGKQVILTNYSAHNDFADEDVAMMVEVTNLEDAHDGIWFDATAEEWQGRPGRWAELGVAQEEQAVDYMRSVHRRKQQGESLFNRLGKERMRTYSWEATVEGLLSAFIPCKSAEVG